VNIGEKMIAGKHNYLVRLSVLFPFCLLLAGCAKEPPGCADVETLNLVKGAFLKAAAKNITRMTGGALNIEDDKIQSSTRDKFDLQIESPRIVEKRADANKLICAAELKVSVNAESAKSMDKIFKRENVSSIQYTSQMTADGKEHITEVSDLSVSVGYVWDLMSLGAFRVAEAEPSKPTEAPAATNALASPNQEGIDPWPSAVRGFQAADEKLNEEYQRAMGRLSEAQKVTLRDEQRDWIQRRDKSCSAEAITASSKGDITGGSAMKLGQIGCKESLTEERTKELTMK
jgi:uncharacterized protein YecT (DUF1311 family)